MDIKEKLEEIDNVAIEYDKENLDLKLRLIDKLLDSLGDDNTEEEVIECLKRVYWITYEIGSSKAFEGSNLELKLVKRTLDIARKWLSHNKPQMILYLKLNLLYSINDPIAHTKLQAELNSIEE